MGTPGERKALLYTAGHRRLRNAWHPLVQTGGVQCTKCGQYIAPGEPWDLGHNPNLVSQPEHPNCNRADGARAGHPEGAPR